MKNISHLQELDRLKQEQIDKAEYLTNRYENGTLNKESYDSQMRGVENSVDILGKEIESEIKNQGLSEQEYQEAREGWQQENERSR